MRQFLLKQWSLVEERTQFHDYSHILLVVVLSMFPLFDLMTPGLFLGHDAQDHAVRIANFYANLSEGTIIPRWAGNLNWGYGHPILMFLYPLPSYFASVFISMGISVVDSVKLVFAVSYTMSGLSMYLFVKTVYGKSPGLFAAVLYQFAPYRFVDLYVRGAIGEHVFFIFPPLVCYCIYQCLSTKETKYYVLVALSVAGMILSHNALSIMFLPVIMVFGLLTIWYRKTSLIRSGALAISGLLGFGLSAFFWVPAFFEGKYTLRDIVTKGELFKHFETLQRLLYSPWNHNGSGQFSVSLGIVSWFVALSIPVVIYLVSREILTRRDSHGRRELLYVRLTLVLAGVSFLASIFMILPYSAGIYESISLFEKFQFPWRWLSLTVFAIAWAGGMMAAQIPAGRMKHVVFVAIALTMIPTVAFWHADGYHVYDETFFTAVYHGTTDTGESAPRWSVRFMEHEPDAPASLISGEGSITEIIRTQRIHAYKISVTSEAARMIENTLYFPGWELYIDGAKQPIDAIQFQDQDYHGIMTYTIPTGEHTVRFVFGETRLRHMANMLSILSLGMIGVFVVARKRIRNI